MKQRSEHLQPGLFDAITPGVVLRPEQTDGLATLLRTHESAVEVIREHN